MKWILYSTIIICAGGMTIFGWFFFFKQETQVTWTHYREDTLMNFEIDYPAVLAPISGISRDDYDSYSKGFGEDIIVTIQPRYGSSTPLENSNVAVIEAGEKIYRIWTRDPAYKARLKESFRVIK